MPMTPTTTTHARPMRKRAPVAALATMSPMSTKPPIAVRIPSVMATSRFMPPSPVLGDERAEAVGVGRERFGDACERAELAAADRHPHVADVRAGVVEQRVELLEQAVALLVRRLDRS